MNSLLNRRTSSWRSFSCLRLKSSLSGPKKRFYKEVTVVQDEDEYELNLDGRKLKTPKGSIFRVRNKQLALAIQTEWLSQKDLIHMDQMHLTTLCNTCIDNPMALNREKLADSILEYLMTDTLCFRSKEPDELVKLENELWDPVVEWFMNHFGVDMSVTADLFSAPVPDETRTVLMKDLLSRTFEALVALGFMTDNLKSAVLSFALINRKLTVERAIRLSRLETEYQVSKWGKFSSHDTDETQIRSRVSAALLFAYFHSDFPSQTIRSMK